MNTIVIDLKQLEYEVLLADAKANRIIKDKKETFRGDDLIAMLNKYYSERHIPEGVERGPLLLEHLSTEALVILGPRKGVSDYKSRLELIAGLTEILNNEKSSGFFWNESPSCPNEYDVEYFVATGNYTHWQRCKNNYTAKGWWYEFNVVSGEKRWRKVDPKNGEDLNPPVIVYENPY